MRSTEYEHLYILRNKDTKKWLLTYWASSQKHKAIFSTRTKAEEALKNIGGNIEVVELWSEEFVEKLMEKFKSEYEQANNLIDFASRAARPSHGGLIRVESSARSLMTWIKKELGL